MVKVHRPSTIPVIASTGCGSTLLSSFDNALGHCGAQNFNLISLSSVIPPATTIVCSDKYEADSDEHGNRLYVVKADQRSDKKGEQIGAGIGWYQWHDGRGVFVEHEVTGRSSQGVADELETLISSSLRDLCALRNVDFCPQRIGQRLCVAAVEDGPTTALVLAIFGSESWD